MAASCTCVVLAALVAPCEAQDFSRVPGVVISYVESPTLQDKQANVNEVYIGSPSITILPNGDYFASHDLFDSGTNEDTTKIFRSTDAGLSWSEVTTLEGQFWSTIFFHQGALYIFGYKEGGPDGDIVIRRSFDHGATWTTPSGPDSGLLREGDYGGTPNAPVVHSGRIWIGQSGARLMSAPVDADLLNANSWTLSNTVSSSYGSNYFGAQWQGWSEGQVVASEDLGVVLLPKVRALPYTGLILAHEQSGNVIFNPNNGFVSLPGGEKKFGAVYDAASERFYVLSNPVLGAHADDPLLGDTPELIRNTAAILSSKDLRNWDVESLFLYSPNLDNGTFGESFQYLNFAIDGDDLAVVARTAFDVGDGENKPPRGHDSNLMTFHRISGFRSREPQHVLVIDEASGDVLRYEITQHERAPLGRFTLGTMFAGAPLSQPVRLAQSAEGDVYIEEQGGRMLRFDAAGNFLDVANAPGITFTGSELPVAQPTDGERTWINPASGNWFDPTNWYYWGRPDTNEEVAVFGSAIEADQTITIDVTFSVKGIRFRNASSYALDGTGEIWIDTDAHAGAIRVELGSHSIRVPVTLANNAHAAVDAAASLRIQESIDLRGHVLSLRGNGRFVIEGGFFLHEGKVVVDGSGTLVFGSGIATTLDGALELIPGDEEQLVGGQVFKLFEGAEQLTSEFDEVLLPKIGGGLYWDTSALYASGVVSIRGQRGDYNGDGAVNAADYVVWRRSLGQSGPGLAADGDGDSQVDGDDLVVWREQFWLGSVQPAQAALVPEPRILALLGLATATVWADGWRYWSRLRQKDL